MIESVSSSSAEQIANLRASMFEKWDTNEDGELSSSEIENLLTDVSDKTDQTLSMEDFLSTLDSSGNGMIDAEELQGLKDILGTPPGEEGDNGPPPDEAAAGAPPPPPPSGGGGDMFSNLDKDENGSVSESELGGFLDDISENSGTSFDISDILTQLDSDGDGELSEEEAAGLKNILGPPPDESGSFAMKNGVHMEDVPEIYSQSAQLASA